MTRVPIRPPRDTETRSVILERAAPTFTEREFAIEPIANQMSLVDFCAYRRGEVYVGHIGLPPWRRTDIIQLAETAANADGLIVIAPDQSMLNGVTNVLRNPYQEPTSDGVVPYTDGVVRLWDEPMPVVPADTHHAWTLTHEGTLNLAVGGDIVATGDATDPVASFTYHTHHVTDKTITGPDGTVVASDIGGIGGGVSDWDPIGIPIVPRASEYRSVLPAYQLWYLGANEVVELDPTPRWVYETEVSPDSSLIETALERFYYTHVVDAEDTIAFDVFTDVFARWFRAETGRSAPSQATIGDHLPVTTEARASDDASVLPACAWRIPRGIASPDIPIDPEVVDG